jgi:CRP-like cAMP-binding protein
MLQQVPLFEMMQEEEVGKLADVLKLKTYHPEECIIKQGEQGDTMYLMKSGEARVEIRVADDVQEHKHYFAGELFGEIALLRDVPRQASIIACTKTEVYGLTRFEFERLLGPLSQLKQNQYASDPRKLIASFYSESDSRGPRGSLRLKGLEPEPERYGKSQWFVVYRPTSRDAIAKMLSGVAVGKGLNVKGKSSKQGILSGLVPFVQISDNNHKKLIMESPANARTRLYFKSKAAREEAKKHLNRVMKSATSLKIDSRCIMDLNEYESSGSFGVDLPEPLLREAYIMQPDLSPVMGWETGRRSEPAYMDMNMNGVRDNSEPKVVLYQNDESDCTNPRGLLIAYAEKYVKPVVSDFDTFLVASKGMSYEQIPADQASVVKWALQQTREVLSTPDHQPWTSRWLTVLKEQAAVGFKYTLPKYGFGEPTSTRLIADVVQETLSCGAIRHGAECFNFTFPQELDDDFLVVWEGYPDKPWAYLTEPQVREFLLERIGDGFAFPVNPVWPVRDKGWYEVLIALRSSPSAAPILPSWFPPAQGILEIIDELHAWKPDGFVMLADASKGKKEEEKKEDDHADKKHEGAVGARTSKRPSKSHPDGPGKPGAKGAPAKGTNAKNAWSGSGSPEQKSAGFMGRMFGALTGRK